MDVRSIALGLMPVAGLALVGMACHDPSDPVAEEALEPESAFAASQAPHTVPFRLSGDAVLISQDFAPGFPGARSDFGGRCSVPVHFLIAFAVSGNVTHMGQVSGAFEHCGLIDFDTGESTVLDGVAAITAANGDELWAIYSTTDNPMGEFDERISFRGGTGRFQQASGAGLTAAKCDRASGTCTIEIRGTVAYHAADVSVR